MSDVFEHGKELLNKFALAQDKVEHLTTQIENEQALLRKAEKKHKECLTSVDDLAQALETLKQAIVPLTERGLKRLKDLISFGLRTIFHDEKYSVDIEIQERGNDKTSTIWLLEEMEDGTTKRCQARDAIGGGIKTIIALILRVFFIIHYQQRRAVALDEPFTDLATHYVEGLFQFLRYTNEELGFDWMIVTHDKRFLRYGDQTYKVEKGSVKVVQKTEEEHSV